MKNIFFICICALFAFTGCTDDDDELLANGDSNINLLPNPQPNDVINEKLFEVINLDYPGLEKMKEYYKIMEDILEVEYRIRATVYVLDELEKSYSEETDFKEKYLLSVFKGALSSIQSNVRETIHYIDQLTAESKRKKQ